MVMALEGVRVLDFTQMMLGPWGTQFLGDMGAEVIKVERPKLGEWERGLEAMGQLLNGTSPFFLAMNRNKKSLAVDLKDPRGKEIIYKLAADGRPRDRKFPARCAGSFRTGVRRPQARSTRRSSTWRAAVTGRMGRMCHAQVRTC